ncbi:MAG: helix-turn-helix domain-containing protein [Candidatus Sulfotelmatobacter sp.]
MNDTETKNENSANGDAVHADAWWPGRQEIAAVAGPAPVVDPSLRSHRNAAEVHAINYALQQTGGNRKRAAKLLNISYRSLLYKIRQHNTAPVASPLPPVRNS